GKIGEDEKPETSCVREIKKAVNLNVNISNPLTQVRHAYTHFRIVMDVFLCRYRSGAVKLNGAADYRWVTVSALKNYPFSKASHKFIPLLKSEMDS
nr:NUDIX domain-containing protein [Deltaproteobacteria bacterium]